MLILHFPPPTPHPCFYHSLKNVDQDVKPSPVWQRCTHLRLRTPSSLPWWRRGDESADDAFSPGPTNCLPGLAADRAASWFLEGLWPSLGRCPPLDAATQRKSHGRSWAPWEGSCSLALPMVCPACLEQIAINPPCASLNSLTRKEEV